MCELRETSKTRRQAGKVTGSGELLGGLTGPTTQQHKGNEVASLLQESGREY